MKIHHHYAGHMTKIAAMSIYGNFIVVVIPCQKSGSVYRTIGPLVVWFGTFFMGQRKLMQNFAGTIYLDYSRLVS